MKSIFFVAFIVCLIGAAAASDPRAPDQFQVLFNTTRGPALIQVVRAWAPIGVDRFYALVTQGYYNDNAFFRVIQSPKPFVAQWGISSDPSVNKKWENAEIPNDPVVKSNVRGWISYAAMMNGTTACCRTTQIYVNYGDNSRLDAMGFAPFAQVISGMENLDQLYSKYGEQPDQNKIYKYGSAYLKKDFPNLDYLNTADLVSTAAPSKN
eukprot:TRINITY_DN3703_c0_g1_i2.p1 TRINITY_DN3703_c0_g1~~TRINITY_DN3703_c0_g1_i2.p1  ORF type:complete len:209 (-),score=48.85 TRINITY_DN3703_c0_g1_i2:120-746(-)